MTIKNEIHEDLKQFETEEEKKDYLKDVIRYGCVSGMVSGLIYYKDTNDFYDKYEDEIEDLITEHMEEQGINKRALFIAGLNGDSESMTQEKNLLSWFAYEEKAREVLSEDFGEEF